MKKREKLHVMPIHRFLTPNSFPTEVAKFVVPHSRDLRTGDQVYGVAVPSTPCWCSACNGTGGRSTFDVQGLDIDVMMEDDEDGEFREAYFGGKTDVPCDSCKGTGIAYEANLDEVSPEVLDVLERSREYYDCEAEDNAIRAAERRMGA